MRLLTRVNEETGLEGEKDFRLKIKNHPAYFITGRSFQQLPPGNCKGKSLSKKDGENAGPRETQMQPPLPSPHPTPAQGRLGVGVGAVFTRSFNQVPIFQSFLFRDYLLTLIVAMPMRCGPEFPPAAQPWGQGGLPLIACVLPFPSGLQGRPIPTYASRTILIEGPQRPADDICFAACRGRPSVQYHVT